VYSTYAKTQKPLFGYLARRQCRHQHSDSKNSRDLHSVNHHVGEETCGKLVSGTIFKAMDKLFLIAKQPFGDLSNTFLKLKIVPKSSPKLLNNLYQ
jgi:hypothetical protein